MSSFEFPQPNDLPPLVVADDKTQARWEQQAHRRRRLDGTWRSDLVQAGIRTVGSERLRGWAEPSLARNVTETILRELAVLYDAPARASHPDEGSGRFITEAWRQAALQPVHQRLQLYTLGIGSCYLRVRGFTPSTPGGLPRARFSVVPPDLIYDEPRTDGSGQPALVRHYSPRVVDGSTCWTADEWDLRDPAAPAYRLLHVDGQALRLLDEQAGDAYPYRDDEAQPVLPYVLYQDGVPRWGLHDPFHRTELFAGGLDVAVFYWLLTHAFRDSSWPQRYAVGATLAGGESRAGAQPLAAHVMDPAVLAIFETLPDFDGQPSIGQFQPGANVESMSATLEDIAARLAVESGVSPTDLQRAAPNRSGLSIALTNEGKRRMQARFSSSFRPADERLARVTAAILNSSGDGAPGLPTSGYRVSYAHIPLSASEQDARRRHVLESIDAGLMSRLEGYLLLHPELTEADALRDLAKIDAQPATRTTEG